MSLWDSLNKQQRKHVGFEGENTPHTEGEEKVRRLAQNCECA